jgi:hypothetical protein
MTHVQQLMLLNEVLDYDHGEKLHLAYAFVAIIKKITKKLSLKKSTHPNDSI